MKRERAFVEKRRKQILGTLIENPGTHVDELAALFHVSASTIRRDLQYLEDQKKLRRYYGGAVPAEDAARERDDGEVYRDLIARYAATLVEDGDTLVINTSTTALRILKYIRKKNVTVITNNARAIACDHPEGVNVILTGGELRYPKEAMVGEFAERNLQKCYAKQAFIGCGGISEECGVTTENANEGKLNELMMRQVTKKAYILADHTKIGKSGSFRTCGIDRVTHLITDEKAPEAVLDSFRDRGIQIYKVRKDDTFE